MKIISTIILLFFVAIPIVFGFGGQTKMRIDEIYNNTGDNIILKPSNKVGIDYLTGDKIIQSTAEGLLEESTVTTTELGYLSGVTSSVQDQISSKQGSITGTDGDLYYWNSGLSNLTIGTEGQFLKVSSLGFPEWVDLPTAVSVTTKGDLQTYSTQADRLPVGTDGQVLQANSATSTGLEWVDADFYTSPLTTEGDLLYRDATQDTRLPIGTEDQVLTVNASGLPVWADSKGGGGSAGINFVVDPSFEKNDLAFTNSLSGTTTYPLYTADDKLYSEFNEAYFQIAHTGLSAANYSTSYTVTRTGLDGKQGLVSIWAKTAAELDLCVDVDTNGCDTTLTLINDDTWRKYEVPIVFGSGNVLLKFVNASITGDVTLQLDNVYVGTMPDGYIQDVGQAHFVGELTWRAVNCIWQDSTASYSTPAADADCNVVSTVGNVAEPSTKIPAVKITNARTDGYYTVKAQGLMYSNAGSSCYFRLDDGNGTVTSVFTDTNGYSANNIVKTFRFNTGGDKEVAIQVAKVSGTLCDIYADSGNGTRSLTFDVHFYPDDNSTIVSQNTELTAKTANELSARFNGVSSCSLFEQNYNWIDSCTKNADGQYTIDITSLGLSSKPVITCLSRRTGGVDKYCSLENLSTNSFSVNIRRGDNDALNDGYFHIKLSKQGADVNKSATIVGKFENINSSDLVSIKYRRSTAQVIPNGTVTPIQYDELIHDNSSGAWDSASGRFTAPKDGTYKVCASWLWDVASWGVSTAQWLYIGSEISQRNEVTTTNTDYYPMFGCNTIKMAKDDTFQIRIQQNSGANKQNISTADYNYMTIDQQADYEAIVKNLSNQKTKCQTKYLSADVSSTGIFMTFSNLVIGKRYSFDYKFKCSEANATADQFIGCRITIEHDGFVLQEANAYNQFTSAIQTNLRYDLTGTYKFVATNTTLDVNAASLVNTLLNGLIPNGSEQLTLCELPDTYVETTEF